MGDRIGKIRKASFHLQRGSQRFIRFSAIPAILLLISVLAEADVFVILVTGIATVVCLTAGLFYKWSYAQLRQGLTKEVRQLEALTTEDQNALLSDFLG